MIRVFVFQFLGSAPPLSSSYLVSMAYLAPGRLLLPAFGGLIVLLCRVPYVRRVLDSSDGKWKLRWTLDEQWHTSRAVDDCCWEAGVVGMQRYTQNHDAFNSRWRF
jgi:hypothetical protein